MRAICRALCRALATAAFALGWAAGCGAPAAAEDLSLFRIGTGGIGGTYYPVAGLG